MTGARRAAATAGRRRNETKPGLRRRLADLATATLRECGEDRVSLSAASLAFHFFVAVFPTALALVAFVHLAGISPEELRGVVRGAGVLLPTQVAGTITEALEARPAGSGATELAFGLLVALWSGIEAMASLQVALDVAYEITDDRGFVRRRLFSLPLLGLTVVLGGSASVLLVLGNPLHSLLPDSFFGSSGSQLSWLVVRYLAAVVALLALLSCYYAVGPNHRRPNWRLVSPGSLFATGGWLVASIAFSTYLDRFGHESKVYGPFAGVVVLLLWMYLTGLMLLVGAELNNEIARTAGRRRDRGVPRRARRAVSAS